MMFILFPGDCFRFSLQAVPICPLLISSFLQAGIHSLLWRLSPALPLKISLTFTIHCLIFTSVCSFSPLEITRFYPQYFPYLPTNYLLFLTYKYSLSALEISSSFTLKYFTIFPVVSLYLTMYALPATHHPRFHLQNYCYLSTTYYLIFTSVCPFSAQQVILISTPKTFPTCHLVTASVYLKNVVPPRDYLRLYPQIFSLSKSYSLPLTSVCSFSALQTQVYSQNLPASPTLMTSFLPQKIYLFSTTEVTSSFTPRIY